MVSLDRVQRIGAHVIIGTSPTVAVAMTETEASTRTVRKRHGVTELPSCVLPQTA